MTIKWRNGLALLLVTAAVLTGCEGASLTLPTEGSEETTSQTQSTEPSQETTIPTEPTMSREELDALKAECQKHLDRVTFSAQTVDEGLNSSYVDIFLPWDMKEEYRHITLVGRWKETEEWVDLLADKAWSSGQWLHVDDLYSYSELTLNIWYEAEEEVVASLEQELLHIGSTGDQFKIQNLYFPEGKDGGNLLEQMAREYFDGYRLMHNAKSMSAEQYADQTLNWQELMITPRAWQEGLYMYKAECIFHRADGQQEYVSVWLLLYQGAEGWKKVALVVPEEAAEQYNNREMIEAYGSFEDAAAVETFKLWQKELTDLDIRYEADSNTTYHMEQIPEEREKALFDRYFEEVMDQQYRDQICGVTVFLAERYAASDTVSGLDGYTLEYEILTTRGRTARQTVTLFSIVDAKDQQRVLLRAMTEEDLSQYNTTENQMKYDGNKYKAALVALSDERIEGFDPAAEGSQTIKVLDDDGFWVDVIVN